MHSAGHLIDLAMAKVGRGDLVPTKCYHFMDGAYVEYEGAVASDDRQKLVENLN